MRQVMKQHFPEADLGFWKEGANFCDHGSFRCHVTATWQPWRAGIPPTSQSMGPRECAVQDMHTSHHSLIHQIPLQYLSLDF